MKQYVLAGLFCLSTTSVLAQNTEFHFDGLYGGAGVGSTRSSADYQLAQTAIGIDGSNHSHSMINNSSITTTDTNLTGAFHVGYGFTYAEYFNLGLEVFGNMVTPHLQEQHITEQAFAAPASLDLKINTNNTITRNTFEYGIDLRPGIQFSQTLVYARIGAAINQLTFVNDSNFSLIDSAIVPSTTVTANLTNKSEKNVLAMRLGLGVQQYIGQQFALALDYVYTDYGCIDNNSVQSNLNPTSPRTFSVSPGAKACVSSNSLMLGANYYFNL